MAIRKYVMLEINIHQLTDEWRFIKKNFLFIFFTRQFPFLFIEQTRKGVKNEQ